MATRAIYITSHDMQRLRALLVAPKSAAAYDHEHLETLSQELDRAVVVDDAEVPADLITMRTYVRVRDLRSDEHDEYTVVYPWEADIASKRVSILAPLGTALLGYREGDQIAWRMPGGVRHLRVESVRRQPEESRKDARAA